MSQAAEAGGQYSRRRFLQLAGASGAAVATAGAGIGTLSLEAEALPIGPTTGGGAYLVRALTDIGGGQTVEPGSSTPEAIAESWYRTGMYAREHDEVTLQTVWNRLEDARTIAYVRAKSAVLEAINNGESESFCLDLARDKVDEHYATVQGNYLNHWKVQVNKLETYKTEVQDHSEISDPEQFCNVGFFMSGDGGTKAYDFLPEFSTREVSLVDGTTKDVPILTLNEEGLTDGEYEPYMFEFRFAPDEFFHTTSETQGYEGDWSSLYVSFRINSGSLSGVDTDRSASWIEGAEPDHVYSLDDSSDATEDFEAAGHTAITRYRLLWDRTVDEHSQMIDNIETWVTNAYGSVQADEKTVEDLVAADPYVLAQGWSTDYENTGHLAYAAADLATLGLSFDSERRMAFQLDDGTQLEGTLYTSNDDFEHDVGTEIDPAARSADFYIAADTSSMVRDLPEGEFRESVDGGQAKLNVSIVEDTEYLIETSHGEEVSVAWDAWQIEDTTANEDVELRKNADSLVVDLSEQLDTAVTSIESISHLYAGDEEAQVMQVDQPFTITEAYDVETGEQVDTVTGDGYDAGTSSVDLSWTDEYLEMRDDTDDYAEDSGGGGGGGLIPNFGGLDLGAGAGAIAMAIQAAILGALAWLAYDILIRDS